MIAMLKNYKDLVICNNCKWAASLMSDAMGFQRCPICKRNDALEVIPVDDHERYSMHLLEKGGVEIEFSKDQMRWNRSASDVA